jgi:hypothetical protein
MTQLNPGETLAAGSLTGEDTPEFGGRHPALHHAELLFLLLMLTILLVP